MRRKELFWMLIPCLLFAGVALFFRQREAHMPPDDGRFHLVIEKIEMPPISAKDAADGYDTEVNVTLNYRGPKPDWWGQQDGAWGDEDSKARLFYEAQGKPKPVKMPPHFKENPDIFYWRPSWNKDTERYKARFFLKLSPLPVRSEKTVLRAPIIIETQTYPHVDLSKAAPLIFTVRGPKETIKKPAVSTNPQLRVIKAEVLKQNGGFDTEVNVHLQDLSAADVKNSALGGYNFVDEKGQHISNSGSSAFGSRGDSHRPIVYLQCQRAKMPKTQRHIYVEMKYSINDRWPLEIRVPIRENGKDLKGVISLNQLKFGDALK